VSRSISQTCTSQSSSRFPRKALAANQIFSDQSASSSSAFVNVNAPSVDKTLPAIPPEDANLVTRFLATSTPPRPRRATITTRSPQAIKKQASFDIDTGSPSKRKDKSKSQGNLLRPIQTIERLELELQKGTFSEQVIYSLLTHIHHAEAMPPKSPRLSTFLDKSLFIASPVGHTEDESGLNADTTYLRSRSLDIDHLTSSLVHVDPYLPRKSDGAPPVMTDTPNRRRVEGVYDRFLMATAGVKRVGRGYQSDNFGPVQDAAAPAPPVSSEDLKLPRTVDESGLVRKTSPDVSYYKDDSNNTVALVRRAFKAVVTGTTGRLSRTVVT